MILCHTNDKCIFPFILGSVYYNKCSIENKIPIILIVYCCVSLLQTNLGVYKLIIYNEKKIRYVLEGLFHSFLVIWIIVGSYYTFNVIQTGLIMVNNLVLMVKQMLQLNVVMLYQCTSYLLFWC